MPAKIKKSLTNIQIEDLVEKIYRLLKKNDLWIDTCIYFNGKCIDNRDEDGHYHYDGSVYCHLDTMPDASFGEVSPGHILDMSFEGPVYHMFNYDKYPAVLRKLKALFARYGLYYVLGHAWTLSCHYEP